MSLPEYCEELTKGQQLAAEHTRALEDYIDSCVKNVTTAIIQKKVDDLYIDEIINEVVERLNALLEPVVKEAVRKETTRLFKNESQTQRSL